MTILPGDLADSVRRALAEDLGPGDVTADLIPESTDGTAMVIAREEAILCGRPWFDEVFLQLSGGLVKVTWTAREGDAIAPEQMICTVEGPARLILSGERTALNFLQTLSGTATATRAFIRAVEGTDTRILDTRKTIPGLRAAQKYAVRCGGAQNHRMGLYDAVLIKENHILAAGSIAAAVAQARQHHPGLETEVEVESMSELDEALAAGVNVIMLDNFELSEMSAAKARAAGRAKLEVSGNVGLERVRAIAGTGVDYISSGALTKHLQAVDFSLRFI